MPATLADLDNAIQALTSNETTLANALNTCATDLQAALAALQAKINAGGGDFTQEVAELTAATSNLTSMAQQVQQVDEQAKAAAG